ncbi:MAG: hypothetical protein ABJ056_06250 [Halioglobus sp.]
MSTHQSDIAGTPKPGFDPRQLIKIAVYGLLLVNFAFYLIEDVEISLHTLRNGGTWLDYTSAFAVSLDTLAWLTLLVLFELETYLLSDDAFTPRRMLVMHSVRIICYLFLAHTLVAYANAGKDLTNLTPMQNITSLCELVEREVSFGYNLAYTELDSENCSVLSNATQFYLIENGTVVTDAEGLQIERELVWLDLIEAVTWLIILLCIELIVRLQDKGTTRGLAIRSASGIKFGLYLLLWGAAAYWIYRGHYMYAWDEALWILGFFAIEMNISDWKKEIRSAGAAP